MVKTLFSVRKVGGITFIKAGRFHVSYCTSKCAAPAAIECAKEYVDSGALLSAPEWAALSCALLVAGGASLRLLGVI